MNSAIITCARFRLEVHRYSFRWASTDVPPEFHSLGETVSALHHLLDSANKADATPSHSHFKHNGITDELSFDLTAAERLMQHLEKVIEDVLVPVHDHDITATAGPSRIQSLSARWALQKEKFLNLHAELKERHHRILADLTRLHAVVTSSDISKLAARGQQHTCIDRQAHIGYDLPPEPKASLQAHEIQRRSILGREAYKTTDLELTHPLKFLAQKRLPKTAPQRQPPEDNYPKRMSRDDGPNSIVPRRLSESHHARVTNPGQSSQGLRPDSKSAVLTDRSLFKTTSLHQLQSHQDLWKDPHLQNRDVQSEQNFRHLEQVFCAVALSGSYDLARISSPPPKYQSHTTALAKPEPRNTSTSYPPALRCKCKPSRAPTTCSLTAFKHAFGSVNFVFTAGGTPGCGLESCPNARPRWYRLLYTLPSWLFHASVVAKFSYPAGGPEIHLRAHRRVALTLTKAGEQSILFAASRGDTASVKQMLQTRQGSVYDIDDYSGTSPLQFALSNGALVTVELVQTLLHAGADLFQVDERGMTACHNLILALYVNQVLSPATRARLESILPMERILDFLGFTTLHKVVLGIMPIDIEAYLSTDQGTDEVNIGDESNKLPVTYAAMRGDAHAVQALVNAGAVLNTEESGTKEMPLLSRVCRYGHAEIVRQLLDAGADPNVRTPIYLSTPLHQALYVKALTPGTAPARRDILERLIAAGADVGAIDMFGAAPLDRAAGSNVPWMLDLIIDAGGDINHRDKEGNNSLTHAIDYGATECVALLLRRGVDVLNLGFNGRSVLHYVAHFASIEMMKVFAEEFGRRRRVVGAVVPNGGLRDKHGLTAWEVLNARVGVDDGLKEAFGKVLLAVSKGRHGESGDDDFTETHPGSGRGTDDDAGAKSESDSDIDAEEFFEAEEVITEQKARIC